jgi:hypothetical protein
MTEDVKHEFAQQVGRRSPIARRRQACGKPKLDQNCGQSFSLLVAIFDLPLQKARHMYLDFTQEET